jgi:hypothetical protein
VRLLCGVVPWNQDLKIGSSAAKCFVAWLLDGLTPELGSSKAFSNVRPTASTSSRGPSFPSLAWPPSFASIILSFFSPFSSSSPLTFLTTPLSLTTHYSLILIPFPGGSPAGHVFLHHNHCPITASLLSGLARHLMYPLARTDGGAIRVTSLAS